MKIKDIEELKRLLKEANIPFETWTGTNKTKTVQELFEEIRVGDSALEINPNTGEIIRQVRFVNCSLEYQDKDGTVYVLKEKYQKTYNSEGEVINYKERPWLQGAIAEKAHGKEDPLDNLYRGLKEEIGIDKKDIKILSSEEFEDDNFKTGTYPGLESSYTGVLYVARVSDAAYIADGYEEVQKRRDNTTRVSKFVWEVKKENTTG